MSTSINGFDSDISRGRRNPNSAAAYERGKAHHALDRERILEMVHNSFMGITSAEIEQRTGVPKNFFGHKRRVVCKLCATPEPGEAHASPTCPGCGSDDRYIHRLIEKADEIKRICHHPWHVEPAPAAVQGVELPNGTSLIQAERLRQVSVEGWTPEHDDGHDFGEMIGAAMTYTAHALSIVTGEEIVGADDREYWPWDAQWWKPSSDPIRNLVKAGALIAAEIDRLQRKAEITRLKGGR